MHVKRILMALLLAMPALPGACASGAEDADLARPNATAIANACGGCHGFSGHGVDSIPAIAGKPEAEFVSIMKEFRDGKRRATVMDRIARGYRDEDFAALAQLYRHR